MGCELMCGQNIRGKMKAEGEWFMQLLRGDWKQKAAVAANGSNSISFFEEEKFCGRGCEVQGLHL